MVKCHPIDTNKYDAIAEKPNIRFVEKWIPVELMQTENINKIIGIESFSLTQIQDGEKSISVLNLMNFKSSLEKQVFTNYLNERSKKIYFVCNLQQLI